MPQIKICSGKRRALLHCKKYHHILFIAVIIFLFMFWLAIARYFNVSLLHNTDPAEPEDHNGNKLSANGNPLLLCLPSELWLCAYLEINIKYLWQLTVVNKSECEKFSSRPRPPDLTTTVVYSFAEPKSSANLNHWYVGCLK